MRNLKSLILNLKSNQGVSLYLTLVIMAILFSIGLMTSTILLDQIRMIKGMGDSVIAFYAADTGIEKVLLNRGNPQPILSGSPEGELDNGASCTVVVLPGLTSDCDADNFCIRSIGSYKDTKRAIEVKY